jgi:hypothetical protein
MRKEDILNNLKDIPINEILSLNPHNEGEWEYGWWIEDVCDYINNEKWDHLEEYLTDIDYGN